MEFAIYYLSIPGEDVAKRFPNDISAGGRSVLDRVPGEATNRQP